MKRLAWIVAAFAWAGPALADSQSALSDYAAVHAQVFSGLSDASAFSTDLPGLLMDGIDGDWVPVSFLFPTGNADAAPFERACSSTSVVSFARRGDYTFTLTRAGNPAFPVVATFLVRGGNSFVQTVNPDQLFAWLGLDKMENMELGKLTAIRNSSGLATVSRPSADLLVIQTNDATPTIYGRCP